MNNCRCYPEDVKLDLDDLRIDIQRRTLMERAENLARGDHIVQMETKDGNVSARCRMFANETLQSSYDVLYPLVCKKFTDQLRRNCEKCGNQDD